MANIATVADEFTFLTHTLDGSDTDFEARLEGLSGAMRRTVDSYLGLA